jgi:hypothetical protein
MRLWKWILLVFLVFIIGWTVYRLWPNAPAVHVEGTFANLSPQEALSIAQASAAYHDFDRWKRITDIWVRKADAGRLAAQRIETNHDIYEIFVVSTSRCFSQGQLYFYIDAENRTILRSFGMTMC